MLPEGASTAPWAHALRVFSASRRLQGWALWLQLEQLAALVLAWRECPPIISGPSGPGDAPGLPVVGSAEDPDAGADRCERTAPELTERLRKVADGYERRHYRLFGFPGSPRQWAEELAPRLVASEVSVRAGLAPPTAQAVVTAAEALFVDDRLPRLRRMLRSGWVDWPKVNLFVRETAVLDPPVARAVDAVVLGAVGDIDTDTDAGPDGDVDLDVVDVLADPAAPASGIPVIARWTLPQLQQAIRAAVLELDPEAAEQRARRARRERHVRLVEDVDGMADFTANVPAEDAQAMFTAITTAAKAVKAAGDPRTLDQLRTDELVHRVTRGVRPEECSPSAGDAPGTLHDDSPCASPGDYPGDSLGDSGGNSSSDSRAAAGSGRCACGRPVPVAFSAAFAARPTRTTVVSLTMSLSTFLGLADQPGRLDGHGPVAAGLARRIAADAATDHPSATAWRCIVTDDVHGTVLGVTDPIWTPRHDPPPRLRNLAQAMEPVCVFPGCRRPARQADLDHRIPYDPDDPAGESGGGRTCSCNLQPLCRTHHQQKTAGLLGVKAVSPDEEPGTPAGTLEWTLPSGVTCRSRPHVAGPAPVPVDGPTADPDVVAAVAHLASRRTGVDHDVDPAPLGPPGTDWRALSWERSRLAAAAARAGTGGAGPTDAGPNDVRPSDARPSGAGPCDRGLRNVVGARARFDGPPGDEAAPPPF